MPAGNQSVYIGLRKGSFEVLPFLWAKSVEVERLYFLVSMCYVVLKN